MNTDPRSTSQTTASSTDAPSSARPRGRWMDPSALAMAAVPQGLNAEELDAALALQDVPRWGALDGQGRGDETLACAWAARERVVRGENPSWTALDLQGTQLWSQGPARLASRMLVWWLEELAQGGWQVWTADATAHYERALQPLLLHHPEQGTQVGILISECMGHASRWTVVSGQSLAAWHSPGEEEEVAANIYEEALRRGDAPTEDAPEFTQPISEDDAITWMECAWAWHNRHAPSWTLSGHLLAVLEGGEATSGGWPASGVPRDEPQGEAGTHAALLGTLTAQGRQGQGPTQP